MVNISTKAKLLMILREKAGKQVSGTVIASSIGVSRVAVWKGIQSLIETGYPIETFESGYALDPEKAGDFLFSWEFGENEPMFRYYDNTGSTMDNARECALQGLPAGTVITAERQNAGRGRSGKTWESQQGGLFCTILERPTLALADYYLSAMVFQIAIARTLSFICGKSAMLRWPNDVYVDNRKIAGVLTELEGEGDRINWLAMGIGVNVNNQTPSQKAVSCSGITGRQMSRREILLRIINEAEEVKKQCHSNMAYSQGNRLLAAEWNSMADLGAKIAVISEGEQVLTRGIFGGVDPAGRCIVTSDNGKDALYFNPGPASIVFINE